MQREGIHTSAENLLLYVNQVIESTADNISSMLQDIRAQRHTEIDYITGFLLNRARAHGLSVPENARLFEQVKRKENTYERVGTDLPRPGSEETEAVTTIDLLARGGVKVTTASVASDGNLTIVCSRGVKLLADAPLVEVADGDFDIIVLLAVLKAPSAFATALCW